MLSDLLTILNALQAIAVIISLAIVAWQTILFVRQTRLNTIISYQQYLKDVDLALLQNPKVTQLLLQESEVDELATILLGLLSLSYELYKEHLMTASEWSSCAPLVEHVMKGQLMRERWERIKHIYKQEFVQFLDGELRKLDREQQISSSIPQSHQPVSNSTKEVSEVDKP